MHEMMWIAGPVLTTGLLVMLLFVLVAIFERLSIGRWPSTAVVVRRVEQLAALVLPWYRQSPPPRRNRSAASGKATDDDAE